MDYKHKYLIDKNSLNSYQSDIFYQKYCKYKEKYLSLKSYLKGGVVPSKKDGAPVGTLFTMSRSPASVFKVVKIVDGNSETHSERLINKDGTESVKNKLTTTVDKYCSIRISLRDGTIEGIICLSPQILLNDKRDDIDFGIISFGIDGTSLAQKINNNEKLNADERAWQMIYNSKMVNEDNTKSSIRNIEEYENYKKTLGIDEVREAEEEARAHYFRMINASKDISEKEMEGALKRYYQMFGKKD